MRKLIKTTAIICACLIMTSTLSSCYGKFGLTRKLYTWNGSLGNKFVKTGVMWVLMIVPVYSAAGFIDFAFLNLVEFWTGSNPIAMNEGDKEVQMVEKNGKQYELTATKNRLEIRSLTEEKTVSMTYNPENGNWVVGEGADQVVVANQSSTDAKKITVFTPEGEILHYVLN